MRGKYIHGVYSTRLKKHARFDTFPPHTTSHVRSSLPQPHLHGSTSCGTLEPALGLPRLRHHDRAFGCHPKVLSRHSHTVSWGRGAPPANPVVVSRSRAAVVSPAAWRPGSLLQRAPRSSRRGWASCCTGLPACTSARGRNRGGTGGGEGRQPAQASGGSSVALQRVPGCHHRRGQASQRAPLPPKKHRSASDRRGGAHPRREEQRRCAQGIQQVELRSRHRQIAVVVGLRQDCSK